MRSLALLSLLVVAIWASTIPTLFLINSLVYAIEASWLRSILGIAVFGAWVVAWYVLLKIISRKILSSRFPKKFD